MLSLLTIILRYILLILFVLATTFYFQRRCCKKEDVSFGEWQNTFFISGAIAFLEIFLGTNWLRSTAPLLFTPINLLLWIYMCKIIHQKALTPQIAESRIRANSQIFLMNKITCILFTLIVLKVAPVLKITSSDTYTQAEAMLWLYEMPMSATDYLSNIVLVAYEQNSSALYVFSLFLAYYISTVAIYSIFANYYRMSNKYQCFFLVLLLYCISLWAFLLYSQTSPSAILLTALGLLCCLIVWWWTHERKANPRILSQK